MALFNKKISKEQIIEMMNGLSDEEREAVLGEFVKKEVKEDPPAVAPTETPIEKPESKAEEKTEETPVETEKTEATENMEEKPKAEETPVEHTAEKPVETPAMKEEIAKNETDSIAALGARMSKIEEILSTLSKQYEGSKPFGANPKPEHSDKGVQGEMAIMNSYYNKGR